MIVALLSRRLRSWLLLTVLLPVVGRVLQALGVRVSTGHPRIGRTLESVGGVARSPRPGPRSA